jgi:hypothetical protein
LSIYPHRYATIALDEVAEVIDYCSLPGFDRRRFADLVDRFGAHDVVSLMRTLAIDLLNRDIFPEIGSEVCRAHPKDLWWNGSDGFPVLVPWRPDDLIAREISMGVIVSDVGANHLVLRRGEESVSFSCLLGGAEDLRRVIHRTDADVAMWMRCEAQLTSSSFNWRISLPHAGEGQRGGLSLNFGELRFEMFYYPDSDRSTAGDFSKNRMPMNGVLAHASRGPASDDFVLEIPVDRFGSDIDDGMSVPVLLSARIQDLNRGPMRRGIVAPLIIEMRS